MTRQPIKIGGRATVWLLIAGLAAAGHALAVCGPFPGPAPGETVVTVHDLTELQAEVDNASGPKTIYLADGVYPVDTGTFVVLSRPDITLRGATGDRDDVVIQGEGMAAGGGIGIGIGIGIYITADRVTVADLTVRDVQNHAIFVNPGCDGGRFHNVRCLDAGEQLFKAGGGTGLPPKNDGVIQCSVFAYTTTLNDGDDGWYTNGIDLLNAHNWVIRDNVLRNIRHHPVLAPSTLAGPAILVWQGSSGTTVERNRIVDCDFGISFGNAGGAGDQHTGGVIRNNFIKGYADSDFGIGLIRSPGAVVIHNTVYSPGSWPFSIEARFPESDGVVIANNLVDEGIWGDRDGASSTLLTNIVSSDPAGFRDVGQGDLHLVSGAHPAVDVGTVHPDRQEDIDAMPVADGMPDAGADEFHLPGDINGDRAVDLSDAVLSLRVAAGLHETGWLCAGDADGDRRVGTGEAVFVMQEIAGLRAE